MPEAGGRPQLAIVAGPNGSGKSTFFNRYLKSQFSVFINADEIAAQLHDVPEDSRQIMAANQAESTRNRLITDRTSFAFETVFSRTDYWLAFIGKAKEQGFQILLFFICTEDPLLNVTRVATRVGEGGHAVPLPKIQARYPDSIRTALGAIGTVDELRLYDNSGLNESPRLVATIISDRLTYLASNCPRWAGPFIGPLTPPPDPSTRNPRP